MTKECSYCFNLEEACVCRKKSVTKMISLNISYKALRKELDELKERVLRVLSWGPHCVQLEDSQVVINQKEAANELLARVRAELCGERSKLKE